MKQNYNLIPMESGYDDKLVATHKDYPDQALRADYCVGGVRVLVFDNEASIAAYINDMNAKTGDGIDTDDVLVRKASDILENGLPVYLVKEVA